MVAPRAKSVAEEAFDELSSLVHNDWDSLDPFTLARLERAARNGISVDPILAHQVLGIVAAIRWDDATMDEQFGIAMRYDTGATVEENYASTLDGVERCIESANMYERAANTHPTDLAIWRLAMRANWQAGRWQRTLELADVLAQRSPDEEFPHLETQKQLIAMAERNGVSLSTIETLHTALYSFLHDRRVHSVGTTCHSDTTPGEESIYIMVRIRGDLEQVKRLDEELTPVLFDAVDDLPLGSFCIGLVAEEREDARVS
ncbi:hypothetical protein WJ542_31710 [Paraburkholderia sp. B3]|uniref:hypothetical protein n=1 Tax=Paraburkholderia sp. B3 TaxID=3134791 RepID=UPI0039824C6F